MNTDNSNLTPAGNFREVPCSQAASLGIHGGRLPSFTSMPLSHAMAMDFSQYQVTQKMDGRTAFKVVNGITIVGEQMRDGSFYAFDLVQDAPLRKRWLSLQAFESPDVRIVPSGHGQEFLEAIWADPKAEGAVLKNWDTNFAVDWGKVKKVESFDVRVTGKSRGAVEISFENQAAGKVALAGANYDLVQVGDVVEISAMKRTAAGKFREPRFIRHRPDKI